jgi:hypothetical protein
VTMHPFKDHGDWKMLIGGDFVRGSGAAALQITNPATGKVLGEAPSGSKKDVSDAVRAAKRTLLWALSREFAEDSNRSPPKHNRSLDTHSREIRILRTQRLAARFAAFSRKRPKFLARDQTPGR